MPQCTPMSMTTRAARNRCASSIPIRLPASSSQPSSAISRSAYNAQPSPCPDTQQQPSLRQRFSWSARTTARRSAGDGREHLRERRWWFPATCGSRLARRHRPPHPARPGQILGRAGVIDAAGLGGRDPALQAAQRFGDLEMRVGQRVDDPIGQLLHPACRASVPCRSSAAPRPADAAPRPPTSRDTAGGRSTPVRPQWIAEVAGPTRRSRRDQPRRRDRAARTAGRHRGRTRPRRGRAGRSRRAALPPARCRRRPPPTPVLQFGMQRIVAGRRRPPCREQLLDRPACSIPRPPAGPRADGRPPRARQRRRVARGDAVGHPGQRSLISPPSRRRCRWASGRTRRASSAAARRSR